METKKIKLGRVGLVPKGAYSPDATYGRMHLVTYKNTTYWSKQEGNTGHEPLGEDEWWGILVDGQAAYAGAFNANEAAKRAYTATKEAERTNTVVYAAEQMRESAETERNKAEEQREAQAQSNAEAEQARAKAEQSRVEAETQRVEAEERRASEETLRAAAEDTRKSDEADRIAGERSREQQEDSRVAAEQTRDADEAQRKIDETQRADEEAKRADAEDARKEAETGRASAETDRAAAETARAKAETARADAENKRAAAETKRENDFSAKVEEVDTAVTNAKTATSEAEKVDATITEANVFEVTDRNGAKKSLELVGQAEAATIKTELAEKVDKDSILDTEIEQSKNLFDVSKGWDVGRPDGTRVEYDHTSKFQFKAKQGTKYYFSHYSFNAYRPVANINIWKYKINASTSELVLIGKEKSVMDGNDSVWTSDTDCIVKFITDNVSIKDSFTITNESVYLQSDKLPAYFYKESDVLKENIKIKAIDDVNVELDKKFDKDNINNISDYTINSGNDYMKTGLNASSRFFNRRSSEVDKELEGNVNVLYIDNLGGNDSNDGKTFATPIKTLSKLKELILDHSIVRLKCGSHFRENTKFKGLNYVRFESYGSGEQPIIDGLEIISDNVWEKVEGYNNIYRTKVHVSSGEKDRAMTQVFLDGRCMCSVFETNDLGKDEALAYLQSHIDNAAWCDAGKYSEGWEEKDAYYYISISDTPDKHIIEANLDTAPLFVLNNFSHISFVGITIRGSGHRDGLSLAANCYSIFFDSCIFTDHAHHGIVFNDACFINCSVLAKSASGIQYHYYTSNNEHNNDIIIANCQLIANQDTKCAAIGGHGAGTDGKIKNIFIENFVAKNCIVLFGNNPMIYRFYVNKAYVEGACMLTSGDSNCNIRIYNSIIKIKSNPGKIGGYGSIMGNKAYDVNILNSKIHFDLANDIRSVLFNGHNSDFVKWMFDKCILSFANYPTNNFYLFKDTNGVTSKNCKIIDSILISKEEKILPIIKDGNLIDFSNSIFAGTVKRDLNDQTNDSVDVIKEKHFDRFLYFKDGSVYKFDF